MDLLTSYFEIKIDSGELLYMEWPPQSPDISPIELLSEEVYRQVQAKKPSSAEHLYKAVIYARGGYFDKKKAAQKSNWCVTRFSRKLPLVIFSTKFNLLYLVCWYSWCLLYYCFDFSCCNNFKSSVAWHPPHTLFICTLSRTQP